jgi:hypothetical protein
VLILKAGSAAVAAALIAIAAIGVSVPAGATTAAELTAPGGTWGQPQPMAGVAALVPSGGTLVNTVITAMSCVTPGNCAAVGQYVYGMGASSFYLSFVVSESNGTWRSAQPVKGITSLGTGTSAVLGTVSCVAPGDCTASGVYQATVGLEHAFFVAESGGTWGTATAMPETSLGASVDTDVGELSCPAAGECTAIGWYSPVSSYSPSAFVLDENNGSWGAPQPVPADASMQSAAGGPPYLTSLSCAAPGDCTAGGAYNYSNSTQVPFLISESGHVWGTTQAIASSTALTGGTVNSVSCPDAADCAAIGYYQPSATSLQAFTVAEAGGSWGQAQTLSVPGAARAAGLSLDCWSAGHCMAAGTSSPATSTSVNEAFSAVESGSGAWGTAHAIAGIPGFSDTYISAPSCTSAGDCTVAGFYDTLDNSSRQDFIATSSAGGSLDSPRPLPSTYAPSGPTWVGPDCTQPGYCTVAINASPVPLLASEATAVTVALTVPTLTYGSEQSGALRLAVSSASGTPTGTVVVTGSAGRTLCRITLTSGTGSCALTAKELPAGSDRLTASYSGDVSYAAASSTKAVPVTRAATTTGLTVSPASMTFTGEATTVKLSVGVASPAGAVTGGMVVKSGDIVLANCNDVALTAEKATCTNSAGILAPGRYGYIAYYDGNADFAPSASATRHLTVSKAKTTTTLTLAKTTVTYGHENAEKLAVSVSHVGGVFAAGKVTVRIGGTVLCTISLRQGSGSCTLASKRLQVGTYHLTAGYLGNGDYYGSVSSSKTLKVTA